MNTGNNNRIPARACIMCLLVLLVSVMPCYAQKGISGHVKDKSGAPVAGAFVSLYGGDSLKGYAICDGDGGFSISASSYSQDWRLIITCIGFRNVELTLDSFLKSRVVRMEQQEMVLKASSVTARVVEQKGDTISYAAGAFKDGTERSLGDLLDKLPGITVSASGGVYHNGKSINKFYVEGMDLMGSNYGVVTKNLSPDVIAQVEVIQRHQPIRALVGLSQSDRSAVNIILKESARNTWMLSADAVGGAPEFPLFDASALLTRFAKENQDLYVIKGNDVGIDIKAELAEQEYFGRTGAFLVTNNGYDQDFVGRLNPTRTFIPVPNEYWYDNITGMGSFNHLKKVNDDLQVRASLSLASERYGESSLSSEIISFADGSSMTIDERKAMEDISSYIMGKTMVEKNSDKVYLSDEISMEGQIRNTASVLDSRGSSSIGQNYSLPSLKIQNILDYKTRTRNGRAASVSSTTKYVRNTHSAHYTGPALDAVQNYGERMFSSDNLLSSSVRFRRLTMGYAAGLDMEYVGLSTSVDGEQRPSSLGNAEVGIFSATAMARVSGKMMIRKTEASFSLPVSMHAVSGSEGIPSLVYPTTTPSLSLTRRISQSLKLDAGSSYTLSRSGVESLFPVAVMTNYRTIAKADSLATRGIFRANSDIEYSNLPRFFTARLSASLYSTSSDMMPVATYDDQFTFSGFTQAPVHSRSWSVNGKLSKHFGAKTFVAELNGGWTRSDQSNYLQGVLCTYTTDSYNTRLRLRTAPVQWFSAEFNADHTYSLTSGASQRASSSLTLNAMLSLKPHKKVLVKTDVDWLKETVPGLTSSNVPLLKTELNWKLSKVTLVATCKNILGVEEFSRQYISAYKTTTFSVGLPGRQFLVGMRMSL